jgi:hypothetical protein
MAFSILTINFTSIPNENEVINISESTNGLNLNQIFKVARYGAGNTEIPEYNDLLDRYIGHISTYYKQAFDLDYNASSLFTVVATNGTLYSGLGSVTITANYDNAVFAVSLNNTDAEITFTNHYVAPTIPDPIIPVVLPDATILSRSPYNVAVTPTVLFDQIIMNLYLYKGHKTTDKPILPNYTLSKIVVYAGQPKIAIEISKIVNDFIKNNYTPTLGGGSNTTSSKDSTWIYAEMTMKYLGEPVYYINQTLHALDGFGYHTELANPTINTNVLSSITKHTFYNGSAYPLYFKTKNLTTITVNGVSVPFTYSQNYSNQIIGMVNIGAYASTTSTFNAVFVYSTGTETHTFEVKEECKYPVINCIFKNKFGFWQNIPFNKLSKKTIDFESQDFMPIVSSFGTYNLNAHNKKTFLNNGKEKVTVNTDFIEEHYNELFKELMLSEFVYLEENGQVLPVNLVKKSFEKKTKLINKLIQYSMDFEYSFDLMNTVI